MFHSGCTIVVGVAAGFQNVVEADHVGLDVGVRIGNGVTNAGLCPQIYHNSRFVICKNPVNDRFVREISFIKAISGVCVFGSTFFNFSKPPFLDGNIIIIIHVIQSHNVDGRLGSEKLQYQIAADEACRTGDENSFIF